MSGLFSGSQEPTAPQAQPPYIDAELVQTTAAIVPASPTSPTGNEGYEDEEEYDEYDKQDAHNLPLDPVTESMLEFGTESVRVNFGIVAAGTTWSQLFASYGPQLGFVPGSIDRMNLTSGGRILDKNAVATPGLIVVASLGHENKG